MPKGAKQIGIKKISFHTELNYVKQKICPPEGEVLGNES